MFALRYRDGCKIQDNRSLLLTIDPREMFGNVDFQTLEASDGVYRFADESGVNQASDNLYAGLRRSSGVYRFGWQEQP